MKIDLTPLHYVFTAKPLLIGGAAMEFYGLRRTGDDIDIVITLQDYQLLVQQYPNNTKDLYGDLGLVIEQFELWTSICLFNYDSLMVNAIEQVDYFIISLEKLLLLKALGLDQEKYMQDVQLISKKIRALQYGQDFRPLDD